MKYLVILVVFLGFAFVIARHDEDAAFKSAQEPASQGNPAVAGVPDKDHPQNHKNDTAWDSPCGHIFHSSFRWPEGITVWAIILTLLAISEQTKHTAKAAQATAKSADATKIAAEASLASVKLQELNFRQWVEIDDWENATRRGFPNVKSPMVGIRFKVGNTTERPLTLTEVTTKHSGLTEQFSPGKLIPPHEGCPVDVVLRLDIPDDLDAYWKNGYATGVAVDVIYEDILGKRRTQHFLYFIQCSQGRCAATEASNRHYPEVIAEISSEPTPPQ